MPKIVLDSPENCYAICKEYAQLWQEFFQYFSEDLTEKLFSEEDEQRFSELVRLLSLKQFRFTQLVGARFSGAGEILKILSETVSLSYLKMLPEASFNKLQVDWHTLFLNMNKCMGKILADIPPQKLAKMMETGEIQAPKQ